MIARQAEAAARTITNPYQQADALARVAGALAEAGQYEHAAVIAGQGRWFVHQPGTRRRCACDAEVEPVFRLQACRSHAARCRSRRNWKNSTPSRSRRFIICGLRTISPTMDAIFGARK